MGLEDFKQDSSGQSKSIKTRKKIENVQMEAFFWDNLICTSPEWAYQAAIHSEGNGDKAILQRMNRAIEQDGADGIRISEETKEDIRQLRDEYIEEHL